MAKRMVKCVVASDKPVHVFDKKGNRVQAHKGDTVEVSETMLARRPTYFVTVEVAEAQAKADEAKRKAQEQPKKPADDDS